jgi:hypothetical protein
MALITFYEPNWERTVRGAYAEALDNDLVQSKVEEIGVLIENNCYLWRIEGTEDGIFVGFVVYQGNGVATPSYNGDMIPKAGHIRPQFAVQPILNEYQTILSTTVNNVI